MRGKVRKGDYDLVVIGAAPAVSVRPAPAPGEQTRLF